MPASGGYDPTICGPAPNEFPVIPSDGILPLFGPTGTVSPRIRPDKLIAPTLDAWNVTVQRQLTNKTSLEIGYVGNHGTHVFKGDSNTYNPNQATVTLASCRTPFGLELQRPCALQQRIHHQLHRCRTA